VASARWASATRFFIDSMMAAVVYAIVVG